MEVKEILNCGCKGNTGPKGVPPQPDGTKPRTDIPDPKPAPSK